MVRKIKKSLKADLISIEEEDIIDTDLISLTNINPTIERKETIILVVKQTLVNNA